MMSPVITLTTDFGEQDSYVASVKGVLLTINPEAVIVDICHTIEPQNIAQAAFIIGTTYRHFPAGTIHMVIVDPGVGSERRALAIKMASHYFVAPDNGVLSYVLEDVLPYSSARYVPEADGTLVKRNIDKNIQATVISNPEYWKNPVSPTFHGRDIFAPVAAYLSLGVPLTNLGEPTGHICSYNLPQIYRDLEGRLIGTVIHIDHFGNAISNIKVNDLKHEKVRITAGETVINGLSRFYAECEGLAAIIGSSGYLELSLKDGSASSYLGIQEGDTIIVESKSGP
jgi:S-adenosylmethionine hydrolase